MRCPACFSKKTAVKDSRRITRAGIQTVERTRLCSCGYRFLTVEHERPVSLVSKRQATCLLNDIKVLSSTLEGMENLVGTMLESKSKKDNT